MRAALLNYISRGQAMTLQEFAAVLNQKDQWLRRNSQGAAAMYPRLPGKPIRFDPSRMMDVLYPPQGDKPRSLTIERHKTAATSSNGGFRKCL